MTKRKAFFMGMRIISLFFGGLIIAIVIALSQVNLETLRDDVAFVLQEAVGMPVEIEGPVSWKFSLRPKVELNKVRVYNAEWAKSEYAFSAEKIDVTLNLISLLQDRPTIQNVKVYDSVIAIEENDKGELSVQPSNEKVAQGGGAEDKPTYPFEDPGLGGLEFKNLHLDVLGKEYSIAGFQIRYVPENNERKYAGWIKYDKKVLPFILSFSEYNSDRKVYPMKVAVSTGGDALIANVALEGTSKFPIDFIIKGDVPDVAAVGSVFNFDIISMPMIKLNLVGGMDRNKISFRKSSIEIRDTKFVLSGTYDFSKKKPSLDIALESESVDLVKIFPSWYYEKNWVRPDRQLNIFKDIPLFGKELLLFDINLKAKLKNFLVYRNLNISDLNLNLNIKNGRGRLDLKTAMAGGDTNIASDFDIDTDGRYYIQLAGIGKNVVVGEILNQVKANDLISGLPTNFDLYVRATGTNLSEIMKTITGPVQVYSVGDGYAHSALVANIYGTDFLTTLRHSLQDLFSSEKKYNQITIKCATVNTKLRKGLIETKNGVALQTNAINLRLAGELDLGQETVDLSLLTVPVRGLKLSLTGNVVNSIQITGNLAEPTIKISGSAVVSKVASATGLGLLLTPLTGGIGLVASAGVGLLAGDLLENWLADENPCKTALEKGAPERRGDESWINEPISDLISTIIK